MLSRFAKGLVIGALVGTAVMLAFVLGLRQASLDARTFVGVASGAGLVTGLVGSRTLIADGELGFVALKLVFSLVLGGAFAWGAARYVLPKAIVAFGGAVAEQPYSVAGVVVGAIATGILFELDNAPKTPRAA